MEFGEVSDVEEPSLFAGEEMWDESFDAVFLALSDELFVEIV